MNHAHAFPSGGTSVEPQREFDWLSDPIPLRLFQGMSDIEITEVGRLDAQAQVGPLTFEKPLVTLTADTELLGSPADEAGLKKGDRVTHLNGVPVLERGCRDFDFQPGESTLLELQRGDRIWEVRVAKVVIVP